MDTPLVQIWTTVLIALFHTVGTRGKIFCSLFHIRQHFYATLYCSELHCTVLYYSWHVYMMHVAGKYPLLNFPVAFGSLLLFYLHVASGEDLDGTLGG